MTTGANTSCESKFCQPLSRGEPTIFVYLYIDTITINHMIVISHRATSQHKRLVLGGWFLICLWWVKHQEDCEKEEQFCSSQSSKKMVGHNLTSKHPAAMPDDTVWVLCCLVKDAITPMKILLSVDDDIDDLKAMAHERGKNSILCDTCQSR